MRDYAAPFPLRLRRFARRSLPAWMNRWQGADGGGLIVSVPPSLQYGQSVAELSAILQSLLKPHTLIFGQKCGDEFRRRVLQALDKTNVVPMFVETLDADSLEVAGNSSEVRIVLFDPAPSSVAPDAVWTSACACQVVVIPETLKDPSHPLRKLVDTAIHVDLMTLLSSITV